uniref:Uncharacterized protein n=1 Tax=Rhizobium rhizogenes TaxID=359 RepID=A0A7S4ZSC6_RHIRH|nr:hypothetical protein pC6.5b_339 [Rhizobium rhizogenes]
MFGKFKCSTRKLRRRALPETNFVNAVYGNVTYLHSGGSRGANHSQMEL